MLVLVWIQEVVVGDPKSHVVVCAIVIIVAAAVPVSGFKGTVEPFNHLLAGAGFFGDRINVCESNYLGDVSGIEDKVLAMYARGMSQRDISDTIEAIYGFEISHEAISTITDRVIETAEEWQNRPLKKFYTFVSMDCLYISIRKEAQTKNCAVYVVLGCDVNGIKDILGIWIGESEGKHYWMQIFDGIKARGVEDILFISMDGVSGLEEGAKSIFKDMVVQRCIVHLIRNSIKYIPSKEYKAYTAQIRKVYGAASLKAA